MSATVSSGNESGFMRTNNFDLIRLVAACQVAIEHCARFLCPELLSRAPWLAFLPGVPVFFFISGFLISASWERSPNMRTYATNRVLRIFPALWLVFVFSVACLLVLSPQSLAQAAPTQLAVWAAAQITMGQAWNPGFLRGYGLGVLNGSLWTIPVELSFYVAIPVIYWLCRKTGSYKAVLAGIAACSFALLWAMTLYSEAHSEPMLLKVIGLTPLPWIGMFACGILAQRNSQVLCSLVRGRFFLFLTVYVCFAVVAFFFPAAFPLLRSNLNPMGAVNFAALILLILSAAFSRPRLADRLLRRNDISYGIYIFHMPIVNALVHRGYGGPLGLAAALMGTLAVAALSWFLIEKRVLRLRHWSLRSSGIAP